MLTRMKLDSKEPLMTDVAVKQCDRFTKMTGAL